MTEDDYQSFLRHRAQRTTGSTRRRSFIWFVTPWVATVVLFSWAYTATSWAPGFILSFAIGGLVGAGFLYAILQSDEVADENRAVLGAKTFSLEEQGVRVSGTEAETWTSWRAVRSVDETEDHVFFYVDRSNALILPKRAFAEPDECARFVAEAGRWKMINGK